MKSKPSDAMILVATNNVDDANQILRQLSSEFDRVKASTDLDLFTADFEGVKPDVLVLAFDTIEKAQSYYLDLYRASSFASQHVHRTVILCGKDEVQAAFRLCKKHQFDDYVLFWPHTFDGPRLAMSIWIACRRANDAIANGPNTADLRAHAQNLELLDRQIHEQLQHGNGEVEVFKQSVSQHGYSVADGLERISSQLHRAASGGAINKLAAQDILTDIEKLKREHSKSFEKGAANIEAVNAWVNEFKVNVGPALTLNRAMVERVDDIRTLILVVDDDPLTQTIISKALGGSLYDCVRANDGEDALVRLRGQLPDVLLVDLNMPRMNGILLAQRIKAVPRLSTIPVVMMTGDASKEVLRSCIRAGATDFLVKPFSRDSLISKLNAVTGRRGLTSA